MIIKYKMDEIIPEITREQMEQLERAEQMPITFDEDCPEFTDEMAKEAYRPGRKIPLAETCIDETSRKYSLSDICLGMLATKESLSDIYDTWIFLVYDSVDDVEGRIAYIGKETTRESDQILKSGKVVTPIYNDSAHLSGYICYDE